jgi:hypothetical protein
MSVPLNKQDYERFLKLAEAIMNYGIGEISIYTSNEEKPKGCYVHIEIGTSTLPADILEQIFNCEPLPQAPTSNPRLVDYDDDDYSKEDSF